jgi:hypothetical protein
MAYLRNRTINLLNLHYGLHVAAREGGGVFFAVFLLAAGVALPVVFTALALILAGRFCVRPLVLVLGKRFGVKPLIVFGSLASAVQYPLLAGVHGLGLPLLELCVASAVADSFYWTSYHAYFASLGDDEHRGHQIGAREALAAVVGVLAPLAGGWALVAAGPMAAFGSAGLAQALSTLPLLWTPNVPVAPKVEGAVKAAAAGVVLFAADGWLNAGFMYGWQIALFATLSQSFRAFGGAMAAAAFAGAVAGLVLGRHVDAGHGRRAAWLAFAAMAAVVLIRALAHSAAVAVIANALGGFVLCVWLPTLMTAVYNLAKGSPCALRFHFLTEGAWDLGCGGGCLVAAALTALGAPISVIILMSLAGPVVTLTVLRRHYGRAEPQPA